MVRNAQMQDLEVIMQIYQHARAFMAANGNPNQWGPTNWPPQEKIEHDIKKNICYVCEEEDRVIGVFSYMYGKNIEQTYNDIEGKWMRNNTYGVIHRLATDGSVRGTGTFCIEWVWNQCGHIRIDTHIDNIIMQKLLEKNGFRKCGIIHVAQDKYPRIAYEK